MTYVIIKHDKSHVIPVAIYPVLRRSLFALFHPEWKIISLDNLANERD
jgi:hypothetical protein